MANIKLSQIAQSPNNVDASTQLVGVENGAIDYLFSPMQLINGQQLARLNVSNQQLSGGWNMTPTALVTGSFTVNCGLSPIQTITNNGNFTITAPVLDGQCIIQMTNGAAPGTVTFSGFTVGSANTGNPLTTVVGSIFSIFIWRINGISHYYIIAAQGSAPTLGFAPTSLSVQSFGAKGDSVTDDTAAIQTAINFAVPIAAELQFPSPTGGTTFMGSFYVISAALSIPRVFPTGLPMTSSYTQGWALIGLGGMCGIMQNANATPIFLLESLADGDNWVNFRIENFQGIWANPQPYPTAAAPNANLDSAVILFDSQGTIDFNGDIGIAQFQIRNIQNLNGCRCVAMKQGFAITGYTGALMKGQIAVWGGILERLSSFFTTTGCVLNLFNNGFNGQPNLLIDHIYMNQGNNTGINFQNEECILILGGGGTMIHNVELNFTEGWFLAQEGAYNTVIDCIRVEAGFFSNNVSLATSSNVSFSCVGSELDIRGLQIQHSIFNFTSPFRALINHAFTSVILRSYDVHPGLNTMISGNFPIVYDGGGGGRTQIESISDFTYSNLAMTASPFTSATTCISQRTLSYYLNSVTANSTTANQSASNIIDEIIEQPCWIFALELYIDAAVTAGTIAVQIWKNGALLDSGNLSPIIGPLIATNFPTTAGQSVLNFASVPSWVQIGMSVTDTSNTFGLTQNFGPIFPASFITAITPTTVTFTNFVSNFNASFTSNSSGTTTLTASAVTGQILPGMIITGTGIPSGTIIAAQLSGTSQGAGTYQTTHATTLSNIATSGFYQVQNGDLIAIGSQNFTAGPQFCRTVANTQCKNSVNANGAYQCQPGDILHVKFVTSAGMTGPSNAKANIILTDLGGPN